MTLPPKVPTAAVGPDGWIATPLNTVPVAITGLPPLNDGSSAPTTAGTSRASRLSNRNAGAEPGRRTGLADLGSLIGATSLGKGKWSRTTPPAGAESPEEARRL